MLRSLAASLVLLVACACEAPALPNDGGTSDSGRDSGTSAEQCGRDSDCGDQTLFCARWRCRPGEAGADARGCLDLGPLCDPGQGCDEDRDQCGAPAWCTDGHTGCMQPGDCDGDGERATQCGGTDCDDEDAARFHANAEVCDSAGHDEDCSNVTLAGESDGDVDGDGFVGEGCCNGATCGEDCDDADRATHPGARELCNGRDDDCNGAIDDEGATPLCPGGTCVAGHCNLMQWSRTFGGTSSDSAYAVTMDDLGNVYVTGYFTDSASFGSATGPEVSVTALDGTPTADVFVAAYGPDGAYRWVYTHGTSGAELGYDIAFDPVSGLVYLAYVETGPIDLDTALVALDTNGNYQWERSFSHDGFSPLFLDAYEGPVVTGILRGTHSFGGPDRTATGADDVFVARYAADGTYRWDYVAHGGAGASIIPGRVAVAAGGDVTLAGQFYGGSADFGFGSRENAGGKDIFAVALNSDGTPRWDYVAGGSGDDGAAAMRVDGTGRAYLVGAFEGTVDFGAGGVVAPAAQSAFLMALDATGHLDRIATWGGGMINEATGVALSTAGDVLVAGTYSGAVNFGGGLTTAPDSGAAVLITFDAAFNHRRDQTFAFAGYPAVPCAAPGGCSSASSDLVVGPADSTALVGQFEGNIALGADTRTSAGYEDGLILRLPN